MRAKHIDAGQVRTAHIQDGAITESKLSDGVEGLQGAPGVEGPPGPKGETGQQGATSCDLTGPSLCPADELPPGQTLVLETDAPGGILQLQSRRYRIRCEASSNCTLIVEEGAIPGAAAAAQIVIALAAA